MVSVEVDGLDEVVRKLEALSKEYPDDAEDILKDNAKNFRKELVRNMRSKIKRSHQSKKSLRKVGSYKIYPVRGYGSGKEIDISATARHFHLFEHGHNQTNRAGTKVIGHVEGRKVMKSTAEEYNDKFPKVVESSVNRLLKKENLI